MNKQSILFLENEFLQTAIRFRCRPVSCVKCGARERARACARRVYSPFCAERHLQSSLYRARNCVGYPSTSVRPSVRLPRLRARSVRLVRANPLRAAAPAFFAPTVNRAGPAYSAVRINRRGCGVPPSPGVASAS